MIATANELVAAFDALPAEERKRATETLLRRWCGEGEIPEAAYDELADELFRRYDAEEAARADS
jgi:hypothetical protein